MQAKFLFKTELLKTELNPVELHQLKQSGVKSIIGKLRSKVWTGLKLRGESVTLRELKFKGLE